MAEDLELKGRIVEDRDLAVLFQEEGGPGFRVWLPRSQIAVIQDVGGQVRVTVPGWLAKAKGIY